MFCFTWLDAFSHVLNSVYYDSDSLGDMDDFLYYQVFGLHGLRSLFQI